MAFKQLGKQLGLLAVFIIGYGSVFSLRAAVTGPCGEPGLVLNILDRPTNAYSPCLVPINRLFVEAGGQAQRFRYSGNESDWPETALRTGLPGNNELMVELPDYTRQSFPAYKGYSAPTVGLRHQLGFTENWVATIQGILMLPGGSAAYGSKEFGGVINGIVTYVPTSHWGLTFMLGVSNQATPRLFGDQRYTSINPDLVFTYVVSSKMYLFGEVYGQTKIGPGLGGGINSDIGMLYLVFPNFSIDLEAGQRISGNLFGFQNYMGMGIGLLL